MPSKLRLLVALSSLWFSALAYAQADKTAADQPLVEEGATTEGSQDQDTTNAEAVVQQLIDDLKHDLWARRAEAESKLLAQGDESPEALRAVLDRLDQVDDPEQAGRLRYILGRVDPRLASFELLRFKIGSGAPELTGVGAVTLRASEKQRCFLESVDLEQNSYVERQSGAAAVFRQSFQLTWTPVSNREIELDIEPGSGTLRGDSRSLSMKTPAAQIYEIGDEARYLQSELVISREEHRFVLIVLARQGRFSQLGSERLTRPPQELLADLERQLIASAKDASIEVRRSALEMLGLLRIEKAAELFEEATGDRRTFAEGALGAAELGADGAEQGLDRLLRDTPPRGLAPSLWRESQLRAAEFLVRDPNADVSRATPLLVDALNDKNSRVVLRAMAALANLIDTGRLPSQRRDSLLAHALSENVLGEAPWAHPEVSYFFVRCLSLLDPELPSDAKRCSATVETLERIAAGKFPVNRIRLNGFLPIYRAALARTSKASTRSVDNLLIAVMSGMESAALAYVIQELQWTHADRPLDGPLFDRMISTLRSSADGGGMGYSYSILQALTDWAPKLKLAKGQLGPWVKALAFWLDTLGNSASHRAHRTALVAELNRLTGLDLRAPTPAIRGIGITVGEIKTTPRPKNAWTIWADQAEAVTAREAELLSLAIPKAPAEKVFLYAFDLELPARREDGERAVGPKILSARKLEVSVGVPHFYEDRWGNSKRMRLEERVLNPASIVRKKSWRIGGTVTLSEAVPLIQTGSRAGLHFDTYGSSNTRQRGFTSSGTSSASRYATLVFADRKNDGVALQEFGNADAAWTTFVDTQLSEIAKEIDSNSASQYLRAVDLLDLPSGSKILRRLLKSVTSPHVEARIVEQLFRLGDPAAKEHLVSKLDHGKESERIDAAISLSELGEIKGPEKLEEFFIAKSPVLNSAARKRKALRALERYLAMKPEDQDTEAKVVNRLFEVAKNSSYLTTSVQILESLSGESFGYRDMVRLVGSKRTIAGKECLERAHQWWTKKRADDAK